MGSKGKSRPEKLDNHFPEYICRRLQKWGFDTGLGVRHDKFMGKDFIYFSCDYLHGQINTSSPFTVSVTISRNYDIPALPIACGFISSVPFKKIEDALSFIKKWFVSLV